MDEHSYIRSVHRYLKQLDPTIYYWKIHDQFEGGVADAWYCGNAANIWIEYKYIAKLPKRPTTLISLTNDKKYLSKLQQNWLARRHAQNNRVAVIVGSPKGNLILNALEWKKPFPTSAIYNRLTRKDIASWIAGEVNNDQKPCNHMQEQREKNG